MNPNLEKRAGYKWFSANHREADEWYGPCETMEAAIMECASNSDEPIFVTQGFKLRKREREEAGHDWECDSSNAIEVILPKNL